MRFKTRIGLLCERIRINLAGPKKLAESCYGSKPKKIRIKNAKSALRLVKKYRNNSCVLVKKCRDAAALKRLERYEKEYVDILDKIKEAVKASGDYAYVIQQEIQPISKIIEGYIRAAANCTEPERKKYYYKAIHMKTKLLFCMGVYSPNTDSTSLDVSVCSVESICETPDKEMEGKVADYYAIPFVTYEGKVICYGRVSVYKSA